MIPISEKLFNKAKLLYNLIIVNERQYINAFKKHKRRKRENS